MLLVLKKLSIVLCPSFPCLDPIATHLILIPVTLVYATIRPFLDSFSMYEVLLEFTFVHSTVWPGKSSITFFHPFHKITSILNASIFQYTMSLLKIIYPTTLIDSAIAFLKKSISVSLVISPLASVLGTSGIFCCSLSMSHVISPITLISKSIFPPQLSFSMP